MQNVKKLVIMIAVAFGVAVVASCILLFSVKKVSADFSVYGDSEAVAIQRELDAFKGKSILFLNTSDVYAVCDNYPYYEITSVKKEYPNVLSVSVRKRVEKFRLITENGTFVLDGNGVVLNNTGDTEVSVGIIDLNVGSLEITGSTAGKKIVTSDDALFYSVIETAQALNLNDVVKSVCVDEFSIGETQFKRGALFDTYTGVRIVVMKVDENGSAKIEKAFEKYESVTDYEKTAHHILAYALENGETKAIWTSRYSDDNQG